MNKLFFDSTNIKTELCVLGEQFNTDKSPYALNSNCSKHRKGFTAIYSMLFSLYKNKKINIAEIGIDVGASLKLWKTYFKDAHIDAYEFSQDNINNCKSMELIKDLNYYKLDITSEESINAAFLSSNTSYDIIIEDTTHVVEDQNRCINNAHKYLKSGGILIIEDIYRNVQFENYVIDENIWEFYSFIICHHDNRLCWDNDVLLYLVKK